MRLSDFTHVYVTSLVSAAAPVPPDSGLSADCRLGELIRVIGLQEVRKANFPDTRNRYAPTSAFATGNADDFETIVRANL